MKKNVVLLGPPGCGKGTQAKNLVKEYGLVHIATGDIFRDIAKNADDQFSRQIKLLIDAGQLVPDELTIKVLQNAIEKNPSENGHIFDGFPRTLPQYEMFVPFLNQKFPGVGKRFIYFAVDDSELEERLLKRSEAEGRVDDSIETIKKRLSIYYQQTEPIIAVLHNKGILEIVYGTGMKIPEVWEQVKQLI